VLQGRVSKGTPAQGFPSDEEGGTHTRYLVCEPPPHFRLQEDQS